MTKQRGISLLSLLIGTLVSMVVVLGMMMTYRSVVQTVVPASEAARRDGERISALLSAHMMLHDAGFGIPTPDPDVHMHLEQNVLLTDSGNLTSNGKGYAVIWAKSIAGSDSCEGLFANENGGLLRLSSDSPCSNAATSWNTLTWTPARMVDDAPHEYLGEENTDKRAIEIEVIQETCRPFGIGEDSGLRARGSVVVRLSYNRAGQNISSSTCLPNFPS